MMPSGPDSARNASYRVQLIMWAAMVFAVVIWFLLIRLVPAPAAGPNSTWIIALPVAAAGLAAASFPAARAIAAGGPAKRRLLLGRAGLILHFPKPRE